MREPGATLPVPDADGQYVDTMPYLDLLALVLALRDDVQALQEQVRRLENRLAKVPVEQARLM